MIKSIYFWILQTHYLHTGFPSKLLLSFLFKNTPIAPNKAAGCSFNYLTGTTLDTIKVCYGLNSREYVRQLILKFTRKQITLYKKNRLC